MLKITLKNIFRGFFKYLNISIINLLGLVLAFTVFIYIGHYVLYEKSFDSFWNGDERIYRVTNITTDNGEITYNGAKTPGGIYYAKDQIPEIEACGFAFYECNQVRREPNALFDQKMLWVTDGFQDVFNFDMLEGTIDFARKCTGIISESKAKVLFGNNSAIGEILKVNEGFEIEITGVFKDIKSNTHIDADYFCSWPSWQHYGWITQQVGWGWPGFWTYFKLKEGSNVASVEQKLADLTKIHLPNLEEQNRTIKYSLQALNNIHFDNSKKGDYGKKVDRSSLINLALFGIFILIVAWINYINLSTALAIKKERAIGIQKLVGAGKKHQLVHVLLENLIFNLLAVLLAFVVFIFTKDLFSAAFGVPLATSYIPKDVFVGWFAIVLFIGLIASTAYSGFSILKINPFSHKTRIKEGQLQKSLVIAQLCLTITFISMSIFIYRQIKFVQEYNLGMNIDDVVVLSGPTSYNGQLNVNGLNNPKFDRFYNFREHLLGHPGITAGTALSDMPGNEMFRNNTYFTRPNSELNITTPMGAVEVDNGIVETMGLKLLAGGDFTHSKPNFYKEVIISRKALEVLGFGSPEEAVGSVIQTYLYHERVNLTIKGVVEDFHFEGLRKQIYPIVFTYGHPTEYGYYTFKVNSTNMQEVVSYIKTAWKQFYPDDPFNFFFQDEFYNRQYESDKRLAKFNIFFAGLSVFISCLGLYGIVLFYLARKRKEIGIRKVNGAPITDIILRLNSNIFIWLGIAMVISIPLSIYLIQKWLENFAYKTTLSWWIFAMAGVLALGIALLTVSWQSWRAATRNPVEALRYE